ncbi:ferredoxin--NADP reductase [Mangrovibacterium lignilyticum]|uniref:ferredoxin--NADP reductase n=1 Tax=Mangrovibacterium lignilyticum TaxID=2668052 RepID=UPI0013CF4478|nr:FAD-dependent oxidoreductase [Mangrovibacterium lignilyticum]
MLAKKYKSEVVSIENPFEGIYTVEFVPLRGKYKFLPGQFLHVALDEEYDGAGQWPESRCFSMQSSPGVDSIKITYAVKGDFTRQMEEQLQVGSEVWLKLPYGDLFQQEHDKTNTVFIAGGTGVTPFLSLFTHESFGEYESPKAYLGFRTNDFNIYQKELEEASSLNLNLNLSLIYQDTSGILDINQIFAENGQTANYFISGPPIMIKDFKNKLVKNGVPPHQVLTDDWE